jgi:hypothetical protein
VRPLRALVAAGIEVAHVVSQPDRRRGRGSSLRPSPVKAAAQELGITVSDRVEDVVAARVPLAVVVAYGRLIKPPVLEEVPMVNLHFSRLPRWARRDTLTKEIMSIETVVENVFQLMDEIQTNLFKKAFDHRATHTTSVSNYSEFKEVLESKGGFVLAHWDGTAETEEQIKNETKATIRCIPLDDDTEAGTCMVTGKPSNRKVIFAKAY